MSKQGAVVMSRLVNTAAWPTVEEYQVIYWVACLLAEQLVDPFVHHPRLKTDMSKRQCVLCTSVHLRVSSPPPPRTPRLESNRISAHHKSYEELLRKKKKGRTYDQAILLINLRLQRAE